MKRNRKPWFAGGLVVLAVAGLLVASGAGAKPGSTCAPPGNVEAIIDDSGSMATSDPNRLRLQGFYLLIDSLDKSTRLGAAEFGSEFGHEFGYVIPDAFTIFPPEPVGPNAVAMRTALEHNLQADHGDTDYNAAFAKADADNPTADARIFLTDSAHQVGTYNDGHLVHPVPTYVVGLEMEPGENRRRLEKIAADTYGRYFQANDASQLQPALNSVGAALTCQTQPRQLKDRLKEGQSKVHSVGIGRRTRSIQITITWSSPLDSFKVFGLRIVSGRSAHAKALMSRQGRRKHKLKVVQKTGATYAVLGVSRLWSGKLRFKVRAAKAGSGAAPAILTTQVSQKRK